MSCVYNTYVNDMQVYSISKSIINHGARNSVKYLEQFFVSVSHWYDLFMLLSHRSTDIFIAVCVPVFMY